MATLPSNAESGTASADKEIKNTSNVKQPQSNDAKKSQKNAPCISDTCVQILAWILVTTGLCIIISTFYLAVRRASLESTYEKYYDATASTDTSLTTTASDADKDMPTINVLDEFNESVRKSDRRPEPIEFQGCQEIDCKIGCVRAPNIYEELQQVMQNTECHYIDMLVVKEQKFSRGIIKNDWQSNRTYFSIRELFIRGSNVTHIKTDAFNSPIFFTTFFLLLSNLKLKKVESGALLGLHSLKYLVINTELPSVDRALFQPVQTTLRFLKLNAELTMDKNTNIFGIAHMDKLEYLDLSDNNLNGPLTKKMFFSTPNLRYFVMTSSRITSIESGTFDSLATTLQLINLSSNFITILSGDVFETFLASNSATLINLSMNSWNCDCLLTSFVQTYTTYHTQFVDILYCRAPHRLYGKSIADVNFKYCTESTTSEPVASGNEPIPIIKENTEYPTYEETTVNDLENYEILVSEDENAVESGVFEMRCFNAVTGTDPVPDADDQFSDSSQSSSESTESSEEVKQRPALASITNIVYKKLQEVFTSSERPLIDGHTDSIHYFEFEPPEFDFKVELLADNSAKVIIDNAKSSMDVIWFCENNVGTNNNINYNCMAYNEPHMITDTLERNVTYTFCIMSTYEDTISPFNCLPLYVPAAKSSEEVLIPIEEKQFTIGMLCLIFLLSAFFGAVLAYFSIRRYPDLLEGSKNVLVVKKSDQNDYVPTMTETDYLKGASFKKNCMHYSTKSASSKSPLTETLTSPMSTPFCISSKNLERLSSVKSSSTLFEESFTTFTFPEDEYETPTTMELEFQTIKCCNNNTYATSPTTPPPLPKRNSSNTDSLNMALKGFSNQE